MKRCARVKMLANSESGMRQPVIFLEMALHPAQDVQHLLFFRLAEEDGRKIRGHDLVALDILEILLGGGGGDDQQFAVGDMGLQLPQDLDARRRLAAAAQRRSVDLVQEQDDARAVAADLDQQFFEVLGQQVRGLPGIAERFQRQFQDHLAAQVVRHPAAVDAVGQLGDQGGFAHPGFADQDDIFFQLALQRLHQGFQLIFPADEGHALRVPGAVAQVADEGMELRGKAQLLQAGTGGGAGAPPGGRLFLHGLHVQLFLSMNWNLRMVRKMISRSRRKVQFWM